MQRIVQPLARMQGPRVLSETPDLQARRAKSRARSRGRAGGGVAKATQRQLLTRFSNEASATSGGRREGGRTILAYVRPPLRVLRAKAAWRHRRRTFREIQDVADVRAHARQRARHDQSIRRRPPHGSQPEAHPLLTLDLATKSGDFASVQ